METVSIIIPSRSQSNQTKFLGQALASIRRQTIYERLNLNVIIGIDSGTKPPENLFPLNGISFVESDGRSQAKALNAGIRVAAGDYVAFLEDDDRWQPKYLEVAMAALGRADFVSSTELEVNEDDQIIRITDFPSPSGWLMTKCTLQTVGEFNETYRFHLDNEWLGRLAETKLKRIHLVESTAPVTLESAGFLREGLASVLRFGGEAISLLRHDSPLPLVRRLVHPLSGICQIGTNPELAAISQKEYVALQERFGRVPY